jgi:PAS domain S-box-containing protein
MAEPAGNKAPQPLFQMYEGGDSNGINNIDLDDLFNDLYYADFPIEPTPVLSSTATTTFADAAGGAPVASSLPPIPAAAPAASAQTVPSIDIDSAAKKRKVNGPDDNVDEKDLTEQQKLERRERNREHAKRSRLRKKFLLESLQEQIHGLEEQIEGLKNAIKTELPHKAEDIITRVCGDKEKFTPLPMPSGFGPVKTLMEPDFRLMSALSGSQQNFAISDPTLPDNPIVYVSQGFLDLTGYTLDQVLGRNCRFLQGPGTDQSAVEVIRKGIAEGVDTSVCLLNYKADGTPFWNQFFVAALRDAENNIVNFVGVQCEVSKAVVEKHMGEQKKKAT